MKRIYLFLSTCLCFALWACSNEEDRLAKKRIFSPEDPPQVVSAAKEVLPAGELGRPGLLTRVVGMGVAETTERLGAHRFSATLRMEWEGNGRKQALTEERVLLSAEGGVAGDFLASLRNGQGQGYDILRIGHEVFAKNPHGTYRQRLRDRGMAERMRQESFGVLGELDKLFGQRMLLKAAGKEVVEGREAHKYLIALGETPREEERGPALPPKLQPKKALDESSRLRLAFFESRSPERLEGELWVDANTSVVLKAQLQGTLNLPEGEANSKVHIHLATRIEHIGQNPQLKIPDTFIPDEDKPQGIAAALERFGLGRKTRTETDSAPVPPDEE